MSKHARYNRNPLALALAAVLILPTGAAFAQSQESAPQEDQKKEEASDATKKVETLDTVVVTGSRIAKDVFNSVSPVQVITREETTVAGFNSTTGVLQSNSVTGGTSQINNAYGGYVVDGGPGVNTLSLRGLGATRTLILLNGRRVSPAGSRGSVGSADLNVLPNSIIDHIEILKDGASSIYGSDAVAGVVNIITRNKVDGLTLEAQNNTTQHGGASETRISALMGKTGDDWRISGSFEIYKRQELTLGDRGWASDCPATGYINGNPNPIDPATGQPKCWTIDNGGVTINTLGTPWLYGKGGPGSLGYYGTFFPGEDSGLPPGYDYFNRWRPNASIADGDLPGFEGVDYYGRDSFDPRMKNQSLISPVSTYTGFVQGGYDLHAMGDAELYFELLLNRRESRQVGYRQLALDYAVGSPLIPVSMRGYPRALPPQTLTPGKNVAYRAFIGFGNDTSVQNVDFLRATAGLRGNLGTSWNYDFMVSHARSDADYSFETFLTDRLIKSLNVVSDGHGGFVCANQSDHCVAAPVLSGAVVSGNLPEAWRNYVFVPVWGNTQYTESTANLNVNGPLFDMPQGTARGAFGIEYRTAKIDDNPGTDSINGNLYNLTSAAPTKGTDSVAEIYGEIELPLLSGMKGAEELSLNVSGRYTDYDSYGDNTTYKVGLLWTPISAVSLRASYGTSYRAPALFEQFVGATSGFLSASADPCDNYGQKEPSSNVYKNCEAAGLPHNYLSTSGVQVDTVGGAATGLKAETSKALTAGLVFQPEFPEAFGNLSFAADYFDIQVDNGVASLSGGSILSQCYGSRPEDFNAGNGLCRLITRNGDNSLDVTSSYVNISVNKVRGWDFTTRYVRDIGPGEFRATASVTNLMEQSGRTFPGDPMVNFTGTVNSPQYTGDLDLSYKFKNWRISYGLDWVDNTSSYEYNDEDPATSVYDLDTPNYFLNNISLQYRGDNWTITGGVRNVADKTPPTVTGALSGDASWNIVGNSPIYSGYDYLGRTFFLNVSKSF